MKKIVAIVAGAALAAVGFVALSGFAGGCGAHRHGPRDPAEVAAFVTDRVDGVLDDVDATPAQREKIMAVKDRLLGEATKLHADRDALHGELLGMWKGDMVDRARLHAIVDQRVDAMRAAAHAAADGAADVHDALTVEQREKLAKKAERWRR